LTENIFFSFPPPKYFGEIYQKLGKEDGIKAVYNEFYKVTRILLDLGINGNLCPVADLYYDQAYIGDRSFGNDPQMVIDLC